MLGVFVKGLGALIGGAAGLFLEALIAVLGNLLLQKTMMREAAFMVIGSALNALARLSPSKEDDEFVAKMLADYKKRQGAGGGT